jgi:AAA+ superfamily predicted ATPase
MILKKYASTSPIPFKGIQWDLIVEKTQKWSGRDLKEKIIKNAIHHAILHEKSQIHMPDMHLVMKKADILIDSLPHYS